MLSEQNHGNIFLCRQSVPLVNRFAGEVHAELLEDFLVDVAQQYGGVDLAALEKRKRVKGLAAVLVIGAQDREGDQYLVRMQTRVLAVKVGDLGLLNRFDKPSGNKLRAVVDAGQMLGGLEEDRGAGTQKIRGLGGQDRPVRELDGR